MKKIVRLTESDLNRIVKKVIILEEWGRLARLAQSFITKNEDDIIRAFKSTEAATAKQIDDIVATSLKSKNINNIVDLEQKLMHIYNPSGQPSGVATAQEQVKKFLNAYSKSKGKSNWGAIRNEAQGIRPQPQGSSAAQPKDPDHAGVWNKPNTPQGASTAYNKLSGNRVSNASFPNGQIDFTQINAGFKKPDGTIQYIKDLPNPMEEYNKMIARAIKNNDYQHISSKGFEKFGISNFREFLKNNIDKVNEVIPETGRWSVNFKPVM